MFFRKQANALLTASSEQTCDQSPTLASDDLQILTRLWVEVNDYCLKKECLKEYPLNKSLYYHEFELSLKLQRSLLQ